MDHASIEVIRHFIEIHAIFIYFIIFFGVVIEGEVAVIFAGIFSYLGFIDIFISFTSVISGGIAKSLIGYSLGCYLNKNHSHKPFVNRIERRIYHFLPHFKDKPFWSIFMSRFLILGIGWFTVVLSGYKRIALSIYAKAEAYSLVLWTIGYLALGHFFGFTALAISKDIRKFLVVILIFFIIFFIIEKIIAFVVELFNEPDNLDFKE